jgi:hypothetical protein
MTLGTDIGGVFDLDATLSTVSGRTALAQAILRRLSNRRGSLIGNSSYGYDLLGLIGSTEPASVVEQRTLEQVLLEEEVQDARVGVTTDDVGGIEVAIDVVDGEGPFPMTIKVASDLKLEMFVEGELVLGRAA